MKALLAKKLGMSHIFDETGNMIPVTIVEAGPCVVTQIKTKTLDGYNAVQLGFGITKRIGKALSGHLKVSKAKPAYIREFKLKDIQSESNDEVSEKQADNVIADLKNLKVGDNLDAGIFEIGNIVQVSGISKGKGFAGTIKRHNFHRGPKTHGSHNYRAPGSIGAMYPEHVFKGKKMAGHMGVQKVTIKNLQIVQIDSENNLLALKGAVPGSRKSLLLIKEAL